KCSRGRPSSSSGVSTAPATPAARGSARAASRGRLPAASDLAHNSGSAADGRRPREPGGGADGMSGTLLDVLEHGRADAPALVVPDGPRLSYADLRREVRRAADAFAAFGLGRGD